MNVQAWLSSILGPSVASILAPGVAEVGQFLGTHLISGMIPAFFIAGAINVFLDKQRITRLMGPKAKPVIAYPIAAFTGGILTVCSCGVIPIFASILNQGAGRGPAFTFLLAAPAINLIALTYTYSLIGFSFTLGRIALVTIASIVIGITMNAIYKEDTKQTSASNSQVEIAFAEDDESHSVWPTFFLFCLLIVIMLTSTGTFDNWMRPKNFISPSSYISSKDIRSIEFLLIKTLVLFTEVLVVAATLWLYFTWVEAQQWLKKSFDLFISIFPKMLLGIFISGILAAIIPLSEPRLMALFDSNTLIANFLAALIGALMYFGTIVGVNIVATLMRYGMDSGPAMTLILAGPTVSLPSILAVVPIIGKVQTTLYFALVVIVSALCGWLYGIIF